MDKDGGSGMRTTTVEFFQRGGADETLKAVIAEFEAEHPDRQVAYAAFSYAHPGRPGDGRWVGVDVSHAARVSS